jgi:hypothetical protein
LIGQIVVAKDEGQVLHSNVGHPAVNIFARMPHPEQLNDLLYHHSKKLKAIFIL